MSHLLYSAQLYTALCSTHVFSAGTAVIQGSRGPGLQSLWGSLGNEVGWEDSVHFPVASVKPYEDGGATVSIKGRSVLSSVTFFGTTSCIHSDSYKTFPQSYMGHKETTPPIYWLINLFLSPLLFWQHPWHVEVPRGQE